MEARLHPPEVKGDGSKTAIAFLILAFISFLTVLIYMTLYPVFYQP